jgi:HK97 family phage portal protein
MWPFNKRRIEQKAGDSLVQYQSGIYFIGSSGKTQRRLKNYIEGYKACDTVFSCVNLIVQSALNVPWYVYKNVGDEVEEVERHPLYDWMEEPGPGMDWKEFTERSYSYFQTAGNNYIKKLIGSQKKYAQVDVLQPQYVEIKTERMTGAIIEYEYKVNGMKFVFPPDEIIHTKTFNPDDPLYGMSTVAAIARQVDISQYGQEWTIALLENEARPSGALVTTARLTEDQRTQLKQEFTDKHAGYQNAGRPLVLEGGLEWKPFSITPKELEFLNSERVNMRKICAAFKVPPELLGDNENKTYSNVKEARKAVYQEAVMPMLEKFKSSLNRTLVQDFDPSGTYFLDFDTSGIEALSEDLDSLWTRTKDSLTGGLITRNEAREAINYEAIEEGEDVLYEPSMVTVVPVSELGQPTPEPPPQLVVPPGTLPEAVPDEDEENAPGEATAKAASTTQGKAQTPRLAHPSAIGGGFWRDPDHKAAKWNSFQRRVRAREGAIKEIAKQFLNGQADRIAKAVRQAPSLDMLNMWALIDKDAEAEKYFDISAKWYESTFGKAVTAGIAATKRELVEGEGKTRTFTPDQLARIRLLILKSGTKIAETTMQEVMDYFLQAEAENWTVEEFAKAIRTNTEVKIPWKARRIAMTEAAKIENYGEIEGYRATEFVDLKGWLCLKMPTSREAHIDADADYGDNPIPLDEPFMVGGEPMMAPLDDSCGAGAGNIINCKCGTFPRVSTITEV